MNPTYQTALSCLQSCRDIGNGKIQNKLIKSNSTDAEASIYLDHDLKQIKVVFKGSKEIKDWVTDAQFELKTIDFYNDKKVKVHKGFDNAVLSIYSELADELFDSIFEQFNYVVIYTGHSLGKSMAEIFAYRIREYIKSYFSSTPLQMIVSFGGPHTGNQIFVDKLNTMYRNFRFYCENDTVPRLLCIAKDYCQSGIGIRLYDISDKCRNADSKAAAVFDHDCYLDYQLPLEKMAREYGLQGVLK